MLEQKHNPQHGSSTPAAGLEKTSIESLKASLQGELLRPGDDAYNDARKVWNGMIDRKPALIVRCTGVDDVINAVNFARTHRLLVSVRGGGHNVAGNAVCEGGIVIDLSGMKGIRVDPVTRTAWVEAGLTLGEFVRETQRFGLGTTVGTVSTTGLSGLTLGGGMGWLMGKYGLTADHLLAVDLVTADGRALRASAGEHPDLFWGCGVAVGTWASRPPSPSNCTPLGCCWQEWSSIPCHRHGRCCAFTGSSAAQPQMN